MLKIFRSMPRGIQAIRRAGPIPSMDIGMAVKKLSDFIDTTTDGSEAYVTRLLDPSGYITQKKGKDMPILKVLASKHLVLQQLIAVTPDGCGQCKWEDLKLMFTSVMKMHSSQIQIVGFDMELTRYLASNYHSMLQDIRGLAKRPTALVGLAAQSRLDEQQKEALAGAVNQVIAATELKAAMDEFDSNILCGEEFTSELDQCGPPKKDGHRPVVTPVVQIDPGARWVPAWPASWVNTAGGASTKPEDEVAKAEDQAVDPLYAEALGTCRPTPPVNKKKRELKEFQGAKGDKPAQKPGKVMRKPSAASFSTWKAIARQNAGWNKLITASKIVRCKDPERAYITGLYAGDTKKHLIVEITKKMHPDYFAHITEINKKTNAGAFTKNLAQGMRAKLLNWT